MNFNRIIPFILLFFMVVPAHAAPDFSTVSPGLTIDRENPQQPLRQGRTFAFFLDRDAIRLNLQEQVATAATRGGADQVDFAAEVLAMDDVEWFLVDEDMTKTNIRSNFPDNIEEIRSASGLDRCLLRWPFHLPTDPREGYILVASARIKWNILRNQNPVFSQARNDVYFSKIHLRILDLEAPAAFNFQPDILHGFCGETLADFNTTAASLAVADRYPPNPPELIITFFDDNPLGFSETPGVLHDRRKAGAWLMLETWQETWTKAAGAQPVDGWFNVDAMSGEKSGGGKRLWTPPIPIAEIAGAIVEVERFGPEQGRKRTGWRMRIPLKSLQEYLASHHPAHARLPLHFASLAGGPGHTNNPALRFTIALSDSSGNMVIPSTRIIPDASVRTGLLTLFDSLRGTHSEPVLQEHEVHGTIQVLDHLRPNAVLIVSNTRAGRTGVFTLSNGDLATKPWADQQEEWLFHHDGSSGVMSLLPEDEREKLANLLQIAENDRLIFQVAAWDNISRDINDPVNGNRHGIATPLAGDPATPSLLRYQTFTLKDPGAISREDTIEETHDGVEIYRYPDYIFRTSGAGDPTVSFYVHDFSLFRAPERATTGTISQTEKLSLANRRAIKLVFSVRKTAISTERLGGEEKVDRE